MGNYLRCALQAVAVKAPGFGDRRKAMLEDIAIVTNGTFLSEQLGIKLENIELDMLGEAERVTITADETTIIEGAGSQDAIRARMNQLRNEIEKPDSNYDREKLEERLAKLSGGVAVIEVGAATETELKEKQHRFEDALSATRAAGQEGIIAGGGASLVHAIPSLDGLEADGDQAIGVEIVRKSLSAPLRQLADNAGYEGAIIVSDVSRTEKKNWGFNARTGELENLVKSGIIDPMMVTRFALENAGSIAGMVLTTEGLVAQAPEEEEDED